MRGRRLIIAIFLIFLAIFTIISLLYIGSIQRYPEIDFFDVGQGDATFFKAPSGQTVLIDGGPDNKILRELGKNMPFYRRRLDYVIISHYHDDHIAGLIEILRRYQVKNLVYSGKNPDSLFIKDLLQVASAHNIRLALVMNQVNIDLGPDCRLDLINPVTLGIKDDPNNSLAAKLQCGGKSALFSGDNNSMVETALLKADWIEPVDIFKASHHGSNTSNSQPLLEKIRPKIIVISVGAKNRYGHPGQYFMERAATLKTVIKRTDQDGSVKIWLK